MSRTHTTQSQFDNDDDAGDDGEEATGARGDIVLLYRVAASDMNTAMCTSFKLTWTMAAGYGGCS